MNGCAVGQMYTGKRVFLTDRAVVIVTQDNRQEMSTGAAFPLSVEPVARNTVFRLARIAVDYLS